MRIKTANKRSPWPTFKPPLRTSSDALQEKTESHTPNDEYDNFVNANLEAAAECIPTKQRTKPIVPLGDISG